MKDVLFIVGPNVYFTNLKEILTAHNISFDFIQINSKIKLKGYAKYILITSFQSLITAYEEELLKKNQFIDEILIINPDFDEFDDLISNFQRRFPRFKYTIYDERIHYENGHTIYNQNNIEYLKKSENNLVKRLKLYSLLKRTHFFLLKWWRKYLINKLYRNRHLLKNE